LERVVGELFLAEFRQLDTLLDATLDPVDLLWIDAGLLQEGLSDDELEVQSPLSPARVPASVVAGRRPRPACASPLLRRGCVYRHAVALRIDAVWLNRLSTRTGHRRVCRPRRQPQH